VGVADARRLSIGPRLKVCVCLFVYACMHACISWMCLLHHQTLALLHDAHVQRLSSCTLIRVPRCDRPTEAMDHAREQHSDFGAEQREKAGQGSGGGGWGWVGEARDR
jgi:hypothetical protein